LQRGIALLDYWRLNADRVLWEKPYNGYGVMITDLQKEWLRQLEEDSRAARTRATILKYWLQELERRSLAIEEEIDAYCWSDGRNAA